MPNKSAVNAKLGMARGILHKHVSYLTQIYKGAGCIVLDEEMILFELNNVDLMLEHAHRLTDRVSEEDIQNELRSKISELETLGRQLLCIFQTSIFSEGEGNIIPMVDIVMAQSNIT